MKRVEVIAMVYKSVDYTKMILEQLMCLQGNEHFDVSYMIIANDASQSVLEYLKNCKAKFSMYNDSKPKDFYLNRVYRAWNYGGFSSTADLICFVNSDMVFSDNWLLNLLKYDIDKYIPCSRLVESGKMLSGKYALSMNFGRHPKEIDMSKFNEYSNLISENRKEDGGLFMPCVFEKNVFTQSGGFPEGNVFLESNELVFGYPNDRPVYMSGDKYFFDKLKEHYGLDHITVFDSVVYHIQEGEKDAS